VVVGRWQVVVVENAVSDLRATVQVSVPPDNQGGVYIDAKPSAPCEGPASGSRCPPPPPPHGNVTTTVLMDDLLEVTDPRN